MRWVVVAVAACSIGGGCNCDPEDIDVSVDCARVVPAARLVLAGDLDGIRPVEGGKRLRVLGNRVAGQHGCSAAGAQVDFLLNLTGDGVVSEGPLVLADGAWEVSIVALSGGGHGEVALTPSLEEGVTHTLSVSGSASGDVQVALSP